MIGVVPKGTSHIFWQSVQAGAIAAGQELGVDVVWNGPAQETEYGRQIQIVDSMIARRVDGLAVAATDKTALVAPIERAAKAGIPVTVFDSGVDSENILTFVATNNYEGGQMAARKLADLVHGQGDVAVVMNAPGSGSTMDRENGFEDAMGEGVSNIHIVAIAIRHVTTRQSPRRRRKISCPPTPLGLAGILAASRERSVSCSCD